MDCLQPFQSSEYEGYFHAADEAFQNGQMTATQKGREIFWKLVFLCQTFGSGALATGCHIQSASLVTHRLLSLRTLRLIWSSQTSCNWHSLWGALVRWQDGLFGPLRQPHQVTKREIFSAKAGTHDGGVEEGGSAHKNKLPVGIDVSECLAEFGMPKDATKVVRVNGDYDLITLYYLLSVGKYTVRGKRNQKNQTVQFKL